MTPTPVFLHGCLGQPASWDAVRERLSPAHRGVALRLPGHGPGAAARASGSFDDAVRAVAEALPNGPVVLVGYSMGARVALALALHTPKRYAGAVLIGCHPGIDDDRLRTERARWDDDLASLAERRGLPQLVEVWERLPALAPGRALPRRALEAQRQGRLDHDAAAIAWALRTLGLGNMPSLADRLGGSPPLVWVVGEHDAKFRGVAEAIQREQPSIDVRVAPGVGHNVVLEAPEWVAERVEELLREVMGSHAEARA